MTSESFGPTLAAMILVHGTCVQFAGAGVLLRGPSGSGKSDLALRLIGAGARLVADDQVTITVTDERLTAGAPETTAGLLEVRGLGLIEMDTAAETRLDLVVDLVVPEAVERMPEPAFVDIQGCKLPLFRLAPFQASAVDKVRLAIHAVRPEACRETSRKA